MGVLDRDYLRNKGAAAKPQWADVAVPLDVLKREKRLKLTAAFVWAALVIGLLAAALTGAHHKEALNCKATSLTADANNDGRFTYQDVGALALQAVTLPLKVVAQRNELQPVTTFFELKPNECATAKAIVLSGALLLAFCVAAIWSLSLALLALRHGVKYLLFDALKVSPFGRYLSTKTVLKAPLQGVLKANTLVKFNLSVPGAEAVVLTVNGQTALTLHGDGQTFTGEGSLNEGEVTVFAKFVDRERLDGLLRYKVKL